MTCPLINTIPGDVMVDGTVAPDTWSLPDGSVADRNIPGYAGIPAAALETQHCPTYQKPDADSLATESAVIHCFRSAGKIIAVAVSWTTPPTGSDTVSIDVKKGNAATPYATILSAPVSLSSADTAVRGTKNGSLTTSPTVCAADDTIQVSVTVTGITAKGLCVQVWTREQPSS